eukprot:1139518-Pelagomonas_calceolata.AAC.1
MRARTCPNGQEEAGPGPGSSQPQTGIAGDFKALGLTDWLVSVCKSLGMTRPTHVQQGCVPEILAGRDVIGLAQTGSGKTAAFALPILQKLAKDPYGVFALVLIPTRCTEYLYGRMTEKKWEFALECTGRMEVFALMLIPAGCTECTDHLHYRGSQGEKKSQCSNPPRANRNTSQQTCPPSITPQVVASGSTGRRELAIQAEEQFRALGAGMSLKEHVIIGGVDMQAQSRALSKRPHVVIATPGRLAVRACATLSLPLLGWHAVRVRMRAYSRMRLRGDKGMLFRCGAVIATPGRRLVCACICARVCDFVGMAMGSRAGVGNPSRDACFRVVYIGMKGMGMGVQLGVAGI